MAVHNLTIKRLDRHVSLPERAYLQDAGLDLSARHPVLLGPGERAKVATGIAVAIVPGHAGLVLPRSGLANRYGIGLVNSPGLIDAGYRGEIHVILINHGHEPFKVERGDRIAQLVVVRLTEVKVVEVDSWEETDRGNGGFGSSGR